jgi:hypothetical protein
MQRDIMSLASSTTNTDASALFVDDMKGKEEDLPQEPIRMIKINSRCDRNVNHNNSDNNESTNDSRTCREDIRDLTLTLTSLSSPRNAGSSLLGAEETTAKHPSEKTEKNISSSTSMSNHTCLTLATTRSSRSGDNGEKDDISTILLVATSASSKEILERDRCSPVSRTEPVVGELVESQSSASQVSVISNWANKYDTEDKDNYDSDSDDDEEEAREDSREVEIRDSVEEGRREEQDIRDSEPLKVLAAIMSDDQDTAMWNCGVSELIAGDETSQTNNHQETITKKDDEQNDRIVTAAAAEAKAAVDNYDLVCTESQEEKDDIWTCNASGFADTNDDTVIETAVEQGDCEYYYDANDGCDDESSAEWFISLFHQSDVTGFNKSSRTMMMVGSLPLSSAGHHEDDTPADPIVPDNKNDAVEVANHNAMAAELDPLAFELDNLSSREIEEEVVFHKAYGEEDDWLENEVDGNVKTEEIPSDSCQKKEEQLAPVTEVNDNLNQGGGIFLKITDAIDTLCLPPQAQQLWPEQNRIFHGVDAMESDDRTIDTITSSSSSLTENPNIEVELHSISGDEEIDKIIVVDAVARALRRSKKRSKRKTEQKNDSIDNHSRSRVSSDAMDVLISLTLMEFCLPNDISIAWSTSASTLGVTTSNNKNREVSETEGLKPCDQIQNSEDETARTPLGNSNAVKESKKKSEVAEPLRDKLATDSRKVEKSSSVIDAETKHDCISGPEIKLNKSMIADAEDKSPKFRLDNVVIKELGLMVDSDSFSIDGLCDKSLSDNDPIRAKPNAMIKNTKPKPSNHKLTMVPLRSDGNNNTTFHRLSTTVSSSFELVNSLSSSEDCHIPSPPQRRQNGVSPNQDQKHETLPFEASSKSFTLPMMDSIPLQSVALSPIYNLPPTTPSKASISPALPPLPISKKKTFTAFHKQLSTSLSDDDYSIQSPSRTEETSKDPLFDTSTCGDVGRQKKILPHLAINRMIRNAKKKSATSKRTVAINQKTASGSLNEKCRTEGSLRLRRKIFPLPSPSFSSRKFGSSKSSNLADEEEEDQENCSPNPRQEPRHRSVGRPLPKGIMRVKHEGASTTPSNHNRSVHWDEEQLANKVEKGIMILASNRKCRPIRKLEQLMLQITAVQNDYGSELDQLIGLKRTAQGYIC